MHLGRVEDNFITSLQSPLFDMRLLFKEGYSYTIQGGVWLQSYLDNEVTIQGMTLG